MSDAPAAGAMPAASQRRRVGHGAVVFAVGPPGNRTAAEVKIRARRIAARPAAVPRSERDDLFGGGETWVGEGGCLGGRRGGLFRRRRDEEGSGRPRFGAAVYPGGDSDGGLLDLGNRHRPRSQKAEHNVDAAGDAAIAVLPAPDGPRADAEQLGGAVLCDAERVEGRAEFGRGHWRVACHDAACRSAVSGLDRSQSEVPPARDQPRQGADHVHGVPPVTEADARYHHGCRRARPSPALRVTSAARRKLPSCRSSAKGKPA